MKQFMVTHSILETVSKQIGLVLYESIISFPIKNEVDIIVKHFNILNKGLEIKQFDE